MNKKTKIGAAWSREGAKGKFLSGEIQLNGEKIKVLIFKNGFKEKDGEKSPDYIIYQVNDEAKTDAVEPVIPESDF